ncbi:MAG: hypothetical protein LPL00_07460, partial [Alphaproteobacteria bacterium]|nr:hypothetical protein [Alphaproteobacteria bacterium]MDX5369400.1 hypothetical protein [Alphaproteobacteria bacterium]MDX5464083.1 hypothetical protein [Alphaproteobacteria bacterium]
MSHGRFAFVTLAIAALILAGAAGFVRLVDPYGLYGAPRFSGFNALKPVAHVQLAPAKLARLERRQAPHLLIGNS